MENLSKKHLPKKDFNLFYFLEIRTSFFEANNWIDELSYFT